MRSVSEFIKFVDASPSPYHAVETTIKRLAGFGFKELKEGDTWKVEAGGKYYVTRNRSAIIAFALGGAYQSGNGFSIVGAHTDSPCLKVKPRSKKEKVGYAQVGVETYGGGIWHSWFDRDLSLAGKVYIKNNDVFEERLVHLKKALLKIPTLAIHLERGVNDNFTFNNEVQLTPILGQVSETLSGGDHHPLLLSAIAKELNISPSQICDFDLCLYDTQGAAVGGANDEFLSSSRLDNLMMSFCAIEGLVSSLDTLASDKCARVVGLFDNEEVGSTTAHGANSNFLERILKRLSTQFDASVTKSLLISADMAHGIHPNYMEKHEENHRPIINKGVVIKHNSNQRYATTCSTCLIVKQAAVKANVTVQEFVVRNDSPCGSTIGPMLSAKLGMRTIDVGNPQWSMHSIRETCGTKDIGDAISLFSSFFTHFTSIDASISTL